MQTTTHKSTESFLDSVYIISHSIKTVKTYRTSLNHLQKFIAIQYDQNEPDLLMEIKNETVDLYQFLRDFIIYLDKIGIKPITIAYQRLKLFLDEDYDISFPVISSLIGDSINKIRFDNKTKKSFLKGLEILIKKTPIEYANYRFTDDVISTLYSDKKQLEFFKKHHVPSFDSTLLTEVCREIRFSYEQQKPLYLDNAKSTKFDSKSFDDSKTILPTTFY